MQGPIGAHGMAERILIIEDESAIADALIYVLGTEGFAVQWCALAGEVLKAVQHSPPALVILDVGLPDQSGFELCRQLRTFSDVPVIFLTARKEEIDRIVGLEIGADDYVVKPFSPREMAARVKAILRRSRAPQQKQAEIAASSEAQVFQLDENRKRIRYHGSWLDLTRYEYLILSTLLRRPQHVLSRAQLMDAVWDDPGASFDRAVDTHIKGIRAKLNKIAPNEDPIRTHRGLGYSLEFTSVDLRP